MAGILLSSRQQRKEIFKAANVSNKVSLSLIWATAVISAVYVRIKGENYYECFKTHIR